MWLNLRGFRVALDDEAAQRMTLGASAMTACAVAFVLLAIVRYSVGRRGASGRRSGGGDRWSRFRWRCRWRRGARGSRPLPPARRSTTADPGGGTERRLAGLADRDRRRVARYHFAGRRRRPPAQFRSPARRRRVAAPRDAAARRSRRRCGRRWPPASCRRKTASARRRCTRPRRAAGRSTFCPDFCLAHALVSAGPVRGDDADVGGGAGRAALVDPESCRACRQRSCAGR